MKVFRLNQISMPFKLELTTDLATCLLNSWSRNQSEIDGVQSMREIMALKTKRKPRKMCRIANCSSKNRKSLLIQLSTLMISCLSGLLYLIRSKISNIPRSAKNQNKTSRPPNKYLTPSIPLTCNPNSKWNLSRQLQSKLLFFYYFRFVPDPMSHLI